MAKLYYKNGEQKDRETSAWSFGEKLGIRLWALAWLLGASWTPKFLNPWRLLLLRMFGAKVHGRPWVYGSARIQVPWNVELEDGACIGPKVQVYSLGKVVVRELAVVCQEAFLCGGTHDLDNPRMPLMVGDIEIGRDAFIGMRAFVMPGVKIGDAAVIGAMAVVTKDVAPSQKVAGNPARVIGERHIHRRD